MQSEGGGHEYNATSHSSIKLLEQYSKRVLYRFGNSLNICLKSSSYSRKKIGVCKDKLTMNDLKIDIKCVNQGAYSRKNAVHSKPDNKFG